MVKKYKVSDRVGSAIFGLIVLVGILVYFKFYVAENTVEEYILPHDNWTPNDGMIDMDCGDSYYDSIPNYDSFNNVPASVDTVIKVDGILYKTNNNKTSWVPVYPDEYVMWVGNNGDTIWE